MTEMTITEALAELKTIGSRINKRNQTVLQYLYWDAKLRDPMEKEGGVIEFVSRERQAVQDLEERMVKIRVAIQRANLDTVLELDGHKRSVSEWLVWRREVAGGQQNTLRSMSQRINQVRQQAVQQNRSLTETRDASPEEIIVTVSERDLAADMDGLEEVLGVLDGRLSLLNATVTIEIPD